MEDAKWWEDLSSERGLSVSKAVLKLFPLSRSRCYSGGVVITCERSHGFWSFTRLAKWGYLGQSFPSFEIRADLQRQWTLSLSVISQPIEYPGWRLQSLSTLPRVILPVLLINVLVRLYKKTAPQKSHKVMARFFN